MFEKGAMLGLFTETPLHPGTGSTTGVVDLPVQRERHTGFPIIQASGLKGAMREVAERHWNKGSNEVKVIFGTEDSDHAGSLAITDARILAFPVRSLSEVYIWVTCPSAISRLKRDGALIDMNSLKTLPELKPEKGQALGISNHGLGNPLILEEISFNLDTSQTADVTKCIEAVVKFLPSKDTNDVHTTVREKMKKHLVVIHHEDFSHLVKTATQISARIVLSEKKTSENLWYEETLPPDCLFYTLLFASKPRGEDGSIAKAEDVLKKLKEAIKDYIQIGGNETIGMGWCALQYQDGGVK
jgi:CRISPR-associated protein Cmr4